MSQTIIGLLITIIGLVASLLKIEIDNAQIEAMVNGIAAVATFIGIIWTWWGRYRQGDITLIGTKK
jgi:hypothetical protein